MTDPGHPSGSDRLGEVAATHEVDVIVNVQGDEPLIEPAVIESVVRLHEEKDPPDISTAAYRLKSPEGYGDPGIVKVVTDRAGKALYFSRSPIPHGWLPGSGQAVGHIGIYAYSRESLLRFVSLPRGELEQLEDLEQLRALENGMKVVVVRFDHYESIGVDRPEDIEKAERLLVRMKNRAGGGSSAGYGEGS
jgi:3-deoxy-manno-octulosonate cytidylyltransferase (CMP-KDO synthetase)